MRHRSAQPAEAGEEHELELVDDRARDADEQIVEATVLEVVLDARPTDPADPAVDDEHLAVIEVPERVQVPAPRTRRRRSGLTARAAWCARTTHTVTPAAASSW